MAPSKSEEHDDRREGDKQAKTTPINRSMQRNNKDAASCATGIRVLLAELHADLFSLHAIPFLEVCIFLWWSTKKEVKMLCPTRFVVGATEIQLRRRRGGRNVQLPGWVRNKIKRQHIITLSGSPK